MRRLALALLVAFAVPQAPDVIDPSLRAAVERFYAMQQAEDAAGYMALWAKGAQDPQRQAQLKFIFDSGDDTFSDLTITSVRRLGTRTVVRLSVTRDRTIAARRPDGSPVVFHSTILAALTYEREGGEWKLVREGSIYDALADMVIAAADASEREKALAAEPDLVNPLLVSAVSRQADAAAQQLNYPRAQALYERALELAVRVGHKQLQADILQNLANTYYYLRNFAGAKPVYEQSVTVQRELGNEAGVATALVGLGTAHYSQFEYTDALATFKEALAIQERLQDTIGLATTLVNTGNVQFVEGDFAGAIVDYRRSRELYRSLADTRGEARALDGLGRSLTAQGDLAAALDAFNGVLAEGRSRNDAGLQGSALLSLGDVHVRLGNLDLARGLFDQSRAQFERLGDLPNVGHAWQAMGRTDLLSGRFASAEDVFARSVGSCTKGEDPECVAHGTVGTAFAQSLQQHHTQAVASYRKAIALFTTLKKREDAARAEIGLSQALTGSGEYAGAVTAARHAQAEGSAIEQEDVVWRALVANARAERRLTNSTAALGASRDAVSHVERMAQRAFDGLGDQPSADSVGAYALLAILQAEANDPVAAFATVERQRAHALRVVLARNERDIAKGMSPAERDAERQLAGEVATVRAQLDHEKALPKPNQARLETLRQRLTSVVEKQSAQRAQLFARLPDLRIWRGLGDPVGLDDAVKGLGDGEALAEFVIDDDDLLVLVATRGSQAPGCRAFVSPVSRQTLAERVAHAVEPEALRDVDAWRKASSELLASIPPGAWSLISDASRAVLVPDDVLWRVPFEALAVGDGYLADHTTVLYAGSVSSLTHLGAAFLEPGPIVAVTAPEIPASTRDRLEATAPGWTLRPGDAAREEMQAFADVFADQPSTILSRVSATESAFRAQALPARAIHIAAPFRLNGASPLFSSILLTAETGEQPPTPDDDGIVEAREVMNVDSHSVVVFTDGGSASMRGAASAAPIVAWAWRSAGTPAIVLPRWSTDDATTAAMMKAMYEALVPLGGSVEGSVQDAAKKIRAAEETRAPFYWAAWQVIGR